MYLKSLELTGFKSFAKKSRLDFESPLSAIVGPNGSGKSNVAEAFRFVLGEQSIKSMRGKRGEDLIFNGSKNIGRMNRASVTIVFDNTSHFLDIDFDEVSFERVVHRDGVNEYRINGSQVRLRDIVLLLATANIGSSGHHIISQGEADRILNANLKERREMIEDALGLKIYQYKKQESERKLERTKENITHVQSLRKEIAPHLQFLQKQVEKVEKARTMREDLEVRYHDYLYREQTYLEHEEARIKQETDKPQKELDRLSEELTEAKAILAKSTGRDEKSKEIIFLEEKLSGVREEKDTRTRELGRLEGQIIFEEKRIGREAKRGLSTQSESVSIEVVQQTVEKIKNLIEEAEEEEHVLEIKLILKKIKTVLKDFVTGSTLSKQTASTFDKEELEALKEKKHTVLGALYAVTKNEDELQTEYKRLQKEIEESKDTSREAERTVFTIMSQQSELRAQLGALSGKTEMLEREQRNFEEELREGEVLVGSTIRDFIKKQAPNTTSAAGLTKEDIFNERREEQEVRRKYIEKLKIRLEEFGGGSGEEIEKEYKESKERDSFLEKEIADLEQSADSLLALISDLDEKLNTKFREGILKINKAFQNLFSLLFGGGVASLSVIKEKKRKKIKLQEEDLVEELRDEEDEEAKEGIDITVSLPRKRIKGLHMLSGGERALTSIALLFAMSQVNPPPFLVLDETDAALDEANSRRYGDMIETLSKYSQLILITHNRETMSRVGILYGITMGADGVSKLLSVQFDKAVELAQ